MKIVVQKIIYPGKSIGLAEGKTVLADEGLPGETIEVSVIEEKKNYIEAKTVNIINPAPERITPCCSHYQACGPYQYIDYKTQLDIKTSQLKEMFSQTPITTFPSPNILGYRNKIRLNIIWKNKKACLAYHAPGSRDKLIEISSCCLVTENINKLLSSFIDIVNKERLDFIKEVEVKESFSTKELMLTTYPPAKIDKIPAKVFIEENICGSIFRVGPGSFFQVNIPMLETALKEMKQHISADKKETIADLYCGIGTFGIALSRFAKEVIGVESEPGNISFLKGNLKLNKIENFRIYEGACEKIFPDIMASGISTLILDPPRKGLDNMLCQNILLSPINKIFYLSCNPTTLSRDIKILGNKYSTESLLFFDFFPQTPHIETLAILEKK